MVTNAPLLDVRGVSVEFVSRSGAPAVRAVDNVSLSLADGEVLGLVGESGCGKTTLGRTILGLQPAHAGSVALRGVPLGRMNRTQLRAARRTMQVVFQNPYASLNPRLTIYDTLSEPLRFHHHLPHTQCRERTAQLMELVGLDPAHLRRFPHEFSGGQRQRVAIARALAVEPDLIIADEPVSSLDVSVQAQVINLLMDLRAQRPFAMIFISHDLAVVRHISDRVAVMRAGAIVECGPRDQVFDCPSHPYTTELLAASPEL